MVSPVQIHTFISLFCWTVLSGKWKRGVQSLAQDLMRYNRTRVPSIVYLNILLTFIAFYSQQTSEVRIDTLMLPSILMIAYVICVHLSFIKLKAGFRHTFQS